MRETFLSMSQHATTWAGILEHHCSIENVLPLRVRPSAKREIDLSVMVCVAHSHEILRGLRGDGRPRGFDVMWCDVRLGLPGTRMNEPLSRSSRLQVVHSWKCSDELSYVIVVSNGSMREKCWDVRLLLTPTTRVHVQVVSSTPY